MKFSDLALNDAILKSMDEIGYSEPTEIQEKAIPIVLNGDDMIGCAQTGTGKTAAFSLPVIQLISELKNNQKGHTKIRSLIVTPTRELAIQIADNIDEYTKYTDIRNTVIYGGVKQHRQVNRLNKGVDILIATPGRLLDLENQGFVDLSHVKYLILDEADRMLDMGFIHDIKRIIKLVPKNRQTLFFSATMPDHIVKLTRDILKNPKRIDVTPTSSAAETVEQHVYFTNKSSKGNLFLDILDNDEMDQVLVFCRTKHGADKVVKRLKKKNISAKAIHGNKSQNQRQKALDDFKSQEIRVLVATDIASRGIDIEKMNYVINYDIPNEPETYVHRIGRTGRAGESGIAISIVEPEENAYIRDIEKLIEQKIPIVKNHDFPQTDKPMTNAEKKEANKEKQRKKQEFFANRKKNKSKRNNKGSKKRGRR